MRSSIRNQILIPFTAVLLAAVTSTALFSAWQAARRSERETVAQLRRRLQALNQSAFPTTPNVLNLMKGLSDAEFATFDASGKLLASTLPPQAGFDAVLEEVPRVDELDELSSSSSVVLDGTRYLAAAVRRRGSQAETTLLVLYPETRWRESRRQAAWPPLFVGAGTGIVMIAVSAWLAARFTRRIRLLEQQVARVASGDFTEVDNDHRQDEIHDLVCSVNTMCRQLQSMQTTIAHSERTRLLGQLAGGLAHQLRNAVTGTRLAVQIHQRRCTLPDDESLDVALRQLDLTEQQVKGLLSLGKSRPHAPLARRACDVITEVAALVQAACEHGEIALQSSCSGNVERIIEDSEPVTSAVLNLTLNAIEAAAGNKHVELHLSGDDSRLTFDVWDNGPGPPPELESTLFDVFVTGKPEGIGLGLALARQVAEQCSGEVTWKRVDGRTRFRLVIPNGA